MRESDIAPETTRAEMVLSAMQAIASWPGATAEAVASAAMSADDAWIRATIIAHADVDGWPLSQRNALLKALEGA